MCQNHDFQFRFDELCNAHRRGPTAQTPATAVRISSIDDSCSSSFFLFPSSYTFSCRVEMTLAGESQMGQKKKKKARRESGCALIHLLSLSLLMAAAGIEDGEKKEILSLLSFPPPSHSIAKQRGRMGNNSRQLSRVLCAYSGGNRKERAEEERETLACRRAVLRDPYIVASTSHTNSGLILFE